jgi:simple sugar transport system ATP-binding protein
VREPLNRFSVAMQQIVAICRAIDLSAKVLILDEPTASLDTQEVEMLFTLMRQLRDNGVSLIFVTHFLDQVYAVSDRITVLRNGSLSCRAAADEIELVKMMLRELDHNALQRAGRTLLSDKPVAAFEGYGKKGTIAPFDLQVRPGEIVGLAGLLGSGRTETAEVIFGIKTADSGKAWIKGKPQTLRSRIRLPASGSASVLKIAKPTALSPPLRCGKISSWPCRRSAAGCGRSPA